MPKEDTDKTIAPPKSFMTAGPTLHYRHTNVTNCWALAVVVFVAACMFWLRILSGTILSTDLPGLFSSELFWLGHYVVEPLSIYEYPWQISVLGLLMGIFAAGPVVVSQLLSFRYSVPMILAVIFVARLPLFGVVLVISCIAAACRPLRFRSRFIAIALCLTPQLIYWGIFGSSEIVDPIQWGFLLAPWFCAWLTGLAIAGIVLGVGHFTRYRPGLIWLACGVVLLAAFWTFHSMIGFAELDYRLYVAGNNPEEAPEFHDHEVSGMIDKAMDDEETKPFRVAFFYPTEKVMLRGALKNDIAIQLGHDRWPGWLKVPDELDYQTKRQWLLGQYDTFIDQRPKSERVAIALYYKAMLMEYSPDIRLFERSELLHFYCDHPHAENLAIWHKLFYEFSQSAESLEARWRIAVHQAGRGEFEKALELCQVAEFLLTEHQETIEVQAKDEKLLTMFRRPSRTVMTLHKLQELRAKLQRLMVLISRQNFTDEDESKLRLGQFVVLNPYSRDYLQNLDKLLDGTKENDPLRDNIELAKVMLTVDAQRRAEQLKGLAEKYANVDGGIEALYELGMLNIRLWNEVDGDSTSKDEYLANAKAVLGQFIELYPESVFKSNAETTLNSLPAD